MLNAQDDVTVVVDEKWLVRARVEKAYPDVRQPYFVVWPPAAGQRHDGKLRQFDLADEGITWVRGFHEKGAPELASLLAYIAMR